MRTQLSLEQLGDRLTPSAGVDSSPTTDYSLSIPRPPNLGIPQEAMPTEAGAQERADALVAQMNDIAKLIDGLLEEIDTNHAEQQACLDTIKDPAATKEMKDAAKELLKALERQDEGLADDVFQAVSKYKGLEAEFAQLSYQIFFFNFNVLVGPVTELPDGYEDYYDENRIL